MSLNCCMRIALVLVACGSTSAYGTLVQVTETFTSNTDASWEFSGNRTSPQDYGWSDTDHTGTGAGELGGVFTRTTTAGASFYGFNVGSITMDHAWHFSGVIRFIQEDPESGAQNVNIGYFTLPESLDPSEASTNTGNGPQNWVGILWNNGYQPMVRARDKDNVQRANNTSIRDSSSVGDGVTAAFSFSYDPTIGNNGALTMTVKGNSATVNLGTAAVFNPFTHFGVMSGITDPAGSWTEVYFDDLTFTAVPEPASLSLLALGGIGLLRRPRRRI